MSDYLYGSSVIFPSAKVALLGEAAVGKSSVIFKLVHNDFQEHTLATIGSAVTNYLCRLPGDRAVKMELWQTGGAERFNHLARAYCHHVQAAVVIYDIMRATSFESAKGWVNDLQAANPNILVALVGNKSDMTGTEDVLSGSRQVQKDEAELYARQNGLLFFETSAKTGDRVFDVFFEIGKRIPQDGSGRMSRLPQDPTPRPTERSPGVLGERERRLLEVTEEDLRSGKLERSGSYFDDRGGPPRYRSSLDVARDIEDMRAAIRTLERGIERLQMERARLRYEEGAYGP